MRTKINLFLFAIFGLLLVLNLNCKKDDNDSDNNNNNTPTLPVVTTTDPTVLSQTSVQCGGTVNSDGGAVVSARGVCWSINPTPTISDSITNDGSGTGSFTSTISGLIVFTTYYVRAYATNSVGTAYGNTVTCATTATVTDYDGNVYQTVKIGTQVWMKENLQVTHYQNGAAISYCIDGVAWNNYTTGAYTNYNFDFTYAATYGRLYNYYAVIDPRNICPVGWHMPSDAEWTTLENFLGGSSMAGGKLKESGTAHWLDPNTGASNSSCFTALPGSKCTGSFGVIGEEGYFWTATQFDTDEAYFRCLTKNSAAINRNYSNKTVGCSVRCIKN
jgi:uncharacterized protein (TIGR02145 family)